MNLSIFRRTTPKTGRIRCGYCSSENVRLSRAFAQDTLQHTYRCRACGRHFKAGLNLRKATLYVFVSVLVIGLLGGLGTLLSPLVWDDGTHETASASEQTAQNE